MSNRYFFLFLVFLPFLLQAQVAYDDCSSAYQLEDLDSWCSEIAAFTTDEATLSEEVLPSCFEPAGEHADIWFSFVAIAPNLSVSVIGAVSVNAGGVLSDPNIALYEGSCGDLNIIGCQTNSFEIDQASIFLADLEVGHTYFIRVSALSSLAGTFELCINNFAEVPNPIGDCEPGVVLCDKSSFSTGFVAGAGSNPNEINDVGCNSATCDFSESSSTWYKWVCDEAGSLTFTISPLNPVDDIDFVLFELPNGIDDCSGKFDIRCMASGENVGSPIEEWVACTGPTGLSLGDPDLSESCGCQVGDNNFAEAIEMEAGKAYALVINNFSQSESGFSIDFGGAGTFLGPEIDFNYTAQEEICIGETVVYEDASSFVGEITSWNWDFGQGADPQTATGPGPHTVTYTNSGSKTAFLRIETDMGCFLSLLKESTTVVCCNNLIEVQGEVTNIFCGSDSTGRIKLNVLPEGSPYVYQWSNGATTNEITNLPEGMYSVTVSDGLQCEKTAEFEIKTGGAFSIDTIVMQEQGCVGGNGEIKVIVEGGVPPYLFDWHNGDGWVETSSYNNLTAGTYIIDINDAADCPTQIEVQITKNLTGKAEYDIPNVFTPNNDSVNDYFKVFTNAELIQSINFFRMEVYNRWGELVFESNEIGKIWDGAYRGKPAASDVYIYRVELQFPCDEETSIKMGEVTLLR